MRNAGRRCAARASASPAPPFRSRCARPARASPCRASACPPAAGRDCWSGCRDRGVSMAAEPAPVTVIRPGKAWRLPNLREIWSFRDLLLLLIRRDFTLRYRQTVLGPIWLLLQPLALTGIFTLIFKAFALLPTGGRPAVLFYFSALIGWSYAAQIVASTAGVFINNASLFAKVWFPRLV